ncbi:MAG: PAS domain S-box protein [Deltaproteobacteria bacterium]|nr:PAS domain S-box protein [Deltaproteobacteria bacterium]
MSNKLSYHELEQRAVELELKAAGCRSIEEGFSKTIAWYRNIFQGSRDGIFVSDRDMRLVYVNAAACDLTGYPEHELLSMRVSDLYEESDLPNYERYHSRIVSGDSITFESKLRMQDGTQIDIESSNCVIIDYGNMFIQTIARNVSERKRVELSLKESEEKFRLLSEQAILSIAILQEDGFKYANEAFLNLIGYSREELFSMSIDDLTKHIHPDFRDFVMSQARKKMAGESEEIIVHYTYKLLTTSGEEKWVEQYSKPVLWEGKSADFITLIDITAHKQAEEALRESEAKYRALVENSSDAIFIAQDGCLRFSNPRTLDLSGYSELDLKTVSFLEIIHLDDREMVLDRHRRRLNGEEFPSTYSFRIVRKNGQIRWVQLNTALITWENRPATLNILRDVSAQKELEDQLRQSQKMEAIGTLAGGIAHDFNNILGAVLGYAQLAGTQLPDDHPARKDLHGIVQAAGRAKTLVRQILAFSRRGETDKRVLDLNGCVQEATTILERTIPKMIHIELALAGDLKAVEGDAQQLEQVIMNLVSNAADAIDGEGRVTIDTQNVTVTDETCNFCGEPFSGDFVRIKVSDTGHGMDEKTLMNIFDPFFTTKEIGAGTGLGLSAVYGIVTNHGGHVFCSSRLHQGATFYVYLPALQPAAASASSSNHEPQRSSGGGRETILIVDDEDDIRSISGRILEINGYPVVAAGSGEEALDVFRKNKSRIKLVILDLGMPGIGGRKCLDELLKIDPKLKVLISSGYIQHEYDMNGLEGAAGFIPKPFKQEEMIGAIRQILSH